VNAFLTFLIKFFNLRNPGVPSAAALTPGALQGKTLMAKPQLIGFALK
jgi:hypothetical protein